TKSRLLTLTFRSGYDIKRTMGFSPEKIYFYLSTTQRKVILEEIYLKINDTHKKYSYYNE
ncbi:MAG: hypothetical protein QMD02_05660, partial [Bacteroidales bacterium]|nr:hypothetical protein [Bacteroidales bacterium]